jgi:magnesium chelatase family protein
MLAKAATKLLPELEKDEILEVNKVYSARGELAANELILSRPYQEASNSVTEAALFGGGTHIRPGLISAAHRGILFFDEVNLTSEAILLIFYI